MPVIFIKAETIAEAWEKAVLEVWRKGNLKLTQYKVMGKGKPVNQLSKAVTALIVVDKPLKEPRVHAGDLMGQQALKLGYIEEVVEGTKDFYVSEGKWDYTYHERLTSYKVPTLKPINQIEKILEKIIGSGETYSRRLQAVTWQAWRDLEAESPPCLQRIWITVPTTHVKPKPGTVYQVNIQSSWRSRDLLDAWCANVNAIVELCMRKIVKPLNEVFEKIDVKFEVGRYVDFSNDLHIYERSFNEVKRFLETLKKKTELGESREKVRIGLSFEELTKRKNV
jgi:thymidylate synthase